LEKIPRVSEQHRTTGLPLSQKGLTSETPRRILKRLHVLNFNDKHITRLGSLNLKGSSEVVDLGQVYVADVVCRIIVLDLAASPVDTLDLYCLAVLDRSRERNCWYD
jgi:hypothetical protein